MVSIIHYGGTVHGRRLQLVPALVAFGLVASGCGDGDGASAPSGSSAATGSANRSVTAPPPTAGCAQQAPEPADGAVTVDVPQATVTLDSPGAGPRRTLALRPTAIGEYSLFTNSLQVSQVTGEQPSGGNRDVTLAFTAQPTCADPLDVVLYFRAPTSTDATMTKALEPEAGTVGRVRLAPTGEVRSFRIAAPQGISSEAQSTFEQALLQTFLRLVPMPAEPVAIGAKWSVTRNIRADSTLTQTMQVTLAGSLDAPQLQANVDESPDDSVFRVPGSEQQLTIESFTSAGRGTLDMDPALAFGQGGVQLEGGRTLIGDDAAKKLTQRTGSVYKFGPKQS
ncbi:hypothetical protein GCM10027289_05530 [Tsukamurella serpentis]